MTSAITSSASDGMSCAYIVLAVCKERVLEIRSRPPRIERDIKRTGLHEVLEEVAAVAQLRTQTVRAAVGELRDAVEAVDLHEMHRNAGAGRSRAPAARAKQDRTLAAQVIIEFTGLRDLIFTLLRQIRDTVRPEP